MALIRDIVEPDDADASIVYKSDDILLKVGEVILGSGSLYITEEHLSWKPVDRSEGIVITWKRISLHGISNIPQESIYFMLDHLLCWPNVYDPAANGNHLPIQGDYDDSETDEGHDSECADEFTEFWIMPTDITAVDPIFQAMKECQSLHPDSEDSVSDESDFMDAVGDENMDDDIDDFGHAPGPGGDNNLNANNENGEGMRNLNLNEDRFADAHE